ncbi:MAG: cytochrome c biosis factor [Planctomycetota bacterium]|nr:cytochrome c biosis factor [Planctomycetota bacterium]
MRIRIRHRALAALAICTLVVAGCNWGTKPAAPPATTKAAPLKDEVPPENLAAFLNAHQEGLGYMERYDYPKAVRAFKKAHELAPGLIAGSINLAIAMLNDTGSQEEKKKDKKGKNIEADPDQPKVDKFAVPLALLDEVIARDPMNLHAHFCRGIILEYLGDMKAQADFVFVRDRDPSDGSAWLKVGTTLSNPDRPEFPAGPKQAKELIRIYTESLKRNPYNALAAYRLSQAYSWAGRMDDWKTYKELREALNPDQNVKAPGDSGLTVYGEMGKYASVINPFPSSRPPAAAGRPPRFETPRPIVVKLAEGDRWVKESDFTGKLAVLGRARKRFGAAVATFDVNRDGKIDLYLASGVMGSKGVRDVLLVNKGDGKFEDATLAFGLPPDRASLGVATGDFDADRNIDLFLTGVGDNRLFRNLGGKSFEDLTGALGPASPAIGLCARWVDLDQDGDLDLYVVNLASAADAESVLTDKPPKGHANLAYRNDGQPAPASGPPDTWAPIAASAPEENAGAGLSIKFTPWTIDEAKALAAGDGVHTAIAILDIDNDRDMDILITADGEPASVILNDRLGRFHLQSIATLKADPPASSLVVLDLDKDGLADLVRTSASGPVLARRNVTTRGPEGETDIKFEPFPIDARFWRSARVADLDLDGSLDVLGLPTAESSPMPMFARAEGPRLVTSALALGPDATAPLEGLAYADLIGDSLPDVVLVRDGEGPRTARNLGNGNHWLGLDLGGQWHIKFNQMRTNSQAIGVRVSIEGDGLLVPYDHTSPEGGLSQSSGPVFLGLGTHQKARLVRLKWPDGVLQCELDEDADKLMPLVENNRKQGSCPVLFTWNGERMVCLGDFLGGGGLGYLVAPGVYGEPDRDEAVAIAGDQLTPVNGRYRISITEPMSELAYLDKITLDVVDRPPGVSAAPDERFAPGGNRPTGKLLAWTEPIEFVRAMDLKGKDVADSLRKADRVFADGFKRLSGWIGYAEDHGIMLDFGDRLAKMGPNDRVALVLVGYTEYPYSQTNYAASTAGVPLKPPVLERLQDDGSWKVIDADPGYPAGMERMTVLELTGKLNGPRCVIRLRTNMEIGWDQAFLAPIAGDAGLRVTTVPVGNAALSHRGTMREVSPDGKLPLTYDYLYVDPAPLANLVGKLTRFGDVTPLLTGDDDRLCILGPGDEVRVEFPSATVPQLPEGWTRSFVLRTIGYCKDADPFTAGSDTVGPLPWRGMPSFPFGPEGHRPLDPGYRAYLDSYQTRSVGR